MSSRCAKLHRDCKAINVQPFVLTRSYPMLCSGRIFPVTVVQCQEAWSPAGSRSQVIQSTDYIDPASSIIHFRYTGERPRKLGKFKPSRPMAAVFKLQSLMRNLSSEIHRRRRLILSEPLYLGLQYPAVSPIIHLQSSDHCSGEDISVVLAGKVEPVDLFIVPPLVEGGCCLVVF